MKLIQGNIQNPIQVAGEVNKALKDHPVVVVTKTNIGANFELIQYAIYASDEPLERGSVPTGIVSTKVG